MQSYLSKPLQKLILEYLVDSINDLFMEIEMVSWYDDVIGFDVKLLSSGREFKFAYENNKKDIMSWIIKKVEPSPIYDDHTDIFRKIWRYGSLDMIQWMYTTFAITSIHIKRYDYDLFEIACNSNRADVVGWMTETFKLDRDECLGRNFRYFISACIEGNLEVIKWMDKRLNVERFEVINTKNNVFAYSLYYNKYNVARWLKMRYNLTSDSYNVEKLLRIICQDGNLKAARWLNSNFNCRLFYKSILSLIQETDENKEMISWLKDKVNFYKTLKSYENIEIEDND